MGSLYSIENLSKSKRQTTNKQKSEAKLHFPNHGPPKRSTCQDSPASATARSTRPVTSECLQTRKRPRTKHSHTRRARRTAIRRMIRVCYCCTSVPQYFPERACFRGRLLASTFYTRCTPKSCSMLDQRERPKRTRQHVFAFAFALLCIFLPSFLPLPLRMISC